MKEVNYILLFDEDLITRSVLTYSIYKNKPGSNVFSTNSSYQALMLLEKIDKQGSVLGDQQEVCFIVDLNMYSLEGYVFLVSLEKYFFRCPIRVYVLTDESRPNTNFPSIEHYSLAGRLEKPLDLEVVEVF